MIEQPLICPCQMQQTEGKRYTECCKPFHEGAPAKTPEQLMRSRFSGFVLGLTNYIRETWHSGTRPADLSLSPDENWLKLDIIKASNDQVHFRAYFKNAESPTGLSVLDETSTFIQENNRWFYAEGNAQFLPYSQNRNDLCLCGSGKKFKKCCV